MTVPVGQYATAEPYWGTAPDNVVSEDDKARLLSYTLFEDIYHNRPETFEVTMRGEDEDQLKIYLPSGKKIVDSTSRFLAVDFDFVVDPNRGTPEDRATIDRMINNIFKREKMFTKHATQRRYGLIRGDAVWHITADDTKEDGKRISIHELHPGQYFPITDPANPDRIMGCHIVDKVQDPRAKDDKSKVVARRQTYRRVVDGEGNPTGAITTELTLWEVGKWDDRNLKKEDLKPVSVIRAEEELPAEVTTIPVYHWRNNPIPGATFGMSEMAGIENLFAAMNQSISDEDLTLIMQGLGMYWTNAAPPQNPDGTAGTWDIGPGVVAEVGDGNSFGRVTGVSSVAPFQDHIKYLDEYAQSSAGVPDIAAGRVDVTVAESGISLQLQMSPILAKNGEKELELLTMYDQMFYDICTQWLPAYESTSIEDVTVASVFGDAMPINREAKIQEIMLLFTSGLITIAMAQAELSRFGYNFAADAEQQVIADAKALAMAQNPDPMANRYAEESEDQQQSTNPQGFTSSPTGGGAAPSTAGLSNA